MGLISGDVGYYAKGKVLKTGNLAVNAYDAPGGYFTNGNVIGSIPPNTIIGTCTGAVDDTLFGAGSWMLSFNGNSLIPTAVFWVKFDEGNILQSDNSPVPNDTGLTLPGPITDPAKNFLSGLFKGTAKAIEIIIGIIAGAALIFLIVVIVKKLRR